MRHSSTDISQNESSSASDVPIILHDTESNDSDESFELAKDENMTPDQVLSRMGSSNIYVLSIWIMMGFVWGLSALPMMVSAFLVGDLCVTPSSGVNGNTSEACELQEGSLVKEFNLVGERAHLGDYSTSGFLFGIVIGNSFLSILSDAKGRRLVLLWSMAMMGVLGCASSFAPDIYSFILLRFLQGIFVAACESIPAKLRSYTALVFGLMWVSGYCAVGPIVYWVPNWHHLMLVTSLPLIFFAGIYYSVVPESFHYLVSRGQVKDVAKWLDSANRGRIYGSKIVLDAAEFCENSQRLAKMEKDKKVDPSKTGLIHELLNSRLLSMYTLVMTYLWTCDTFIYYVLSLFSTQLAGDRYTNYALMGLIEIPAYAVSSILLNRFGRRLFVSLCHLLAAVSFFTVYFCDNPQISLMMWLLGKFAISSAFTSLFVYASEVFPTVTRNGCIGICSVVSRLGGSFAPMVGTVMPTFFFGLCASIAAAMTLVLPETLNRELPDSTEQMRAGNRNAATTCRHRRKSDVILVH
ncbi:major facilitator superfamily domain-containing protein [Ditylenchus destructor]|uniref:Major facilitator superfamily domain-containing protein n=1 Tax=Ditylenchus destructor TaxID=166010 RepID=A0AAD4QYP3_9BILA|nr:major facilitator superfamily domain-containing protein [Ditylenchus destructor]